MEKQTVIDLFGWGFTLWLIGYILGILFYFVLPAALIGWAILPIGLIVTFWVLMKKISRTDFRYYVQLSIVWAVIAVVCDYLFIVILLNPAGGYYKPDVFVYYLITVASPLVAGVWKNRNV